MNVNWTQVAHYGSAVVSLALGALAEAGVQFPGVTVDPHVAWTVGLTVLVTGLNGGGHAVTGAKPNA